MIDVIVLAAQIAGAQAAGGSLTRVPAAQLTSLGIRSEPASSTAGLEEPPTVVRSPDKRRTARVRDLPRGPESRRSRIDISATGRRTIALATLVNYYGLAWSPDSTKVAFSEGAVVTVADSDGKTRQVIHTGPGGRYPGACFDLRWSKDGQTLSFTQVENASQLDLSKPMRVSMTLGVRPRVP